MASRNDCETLETGIHKGTADPSRASDETVATKSFRSEKEQGRDDICDDHADPESDRENELEERDDPNFDSTLRWSPGSLVKFDVSDPVTARHSPKFLVKDDPEGEGTPFNPFHCFAGANPSSDSDDTHSSAKTHNRSLGYPQPPAIDNRSLDSLQIDATPGNELTERFSPERMNLDTMVTDNHHPNGPAQGDGNLTFEYLPWPYNTNDDSTEKPSAVEPPANPRVIHTPHGPAFLLTAPPQPPAAKALSRLSLLPSPRKRKFQRWSDEEDAILRLAVDSAEDKKPNWREISATFFANTRSALQCKTRWNKALKPGIMIGNWEDHEDAVVREMRSEGFKWSQIAQELPGRIPEHVRDRYVNFLDPELKKSPWTNEEDKILYDKQKLLGNTWSAIAKFLPGRSENSVKNRWHNAKMTQRRRLRKHAAQRKQEVAKSKRAMNSEPDPASDVGPVSEDISISEKTSDEEEGLVAEI